MTDTPAFNDIVKAACAAWRDGKGICRAPHWECDVDVIVKDALAAALADTPAVVELMAFAADCPRGRQRAALAALRQHLLGEG